MSRFDRNQPVDDFSWSPDCKRLAFILPEGTFEHTLAVVTSDGANLDKLGAKGDSTGIVSSNYKAYKFYDRSAAYKLGWVKDNELKILILLMQMYTNRSNEVHPSRKLPTD